MANIFTRRVRCPECESHNVTLEDDINKLYCESCGCTF